MELPYQFEEYHHVRVKPGWPKGRKKGPNYKGRKSGMKYKKSQKQMQKELKKHCESKTQWSEHGALISGHTFVEVEQADPTKQVLKCTSCGEESVGIIKPKT